MSSSAKRKILYKTGAMQNSREKGIVKISRVYKIGIEKKGENKNT
jgi:hypothetical protein